MEFMEDIRVSSWYELNERLYENLWNERLGRFRSNFAFLGVDAVVWCVDYAHTNSLLPDTLKAELLKEDSIVFTADMLDEAASTLQELDGLSHDEFLVFFEPPSLDDRIVNQYALFSLMSGPTARADEWLSRNPELFRRIIIPATLKWEIRDKLDQANITERVLFPGLDGLSQWLKRYYSPRV